jgi:hypothetical protein
MNSIKEMFHNLYINISHKYSIYGIDYRSLLDKHMGKSNINNKKSIYGDKI